MKSPPVGFFACSKTHRTPGVVVAILHQALPTGHGIVHVTLSF
jgi:hypothetical protein